MNIFRSFAAPVAAIILLAASAPTSAKGRPTLLWNLTVVQLLDGSDVVRDDTANNAAWSAPRTTASTGETESTPDAPSAAPKSGAETGSPSPFVPNFDSSPRAGQGEAPDSPQRLSATSQPAESTPVTLISDDGEIIVGGVRVHFRRDGLSIRDAAGEQPIAKSTSVRIICQPGLLTFADSGAAELSVGTEAQYLKASPDGSLRLATWEGQMEGITIAVSADHGDANSVSVNDLRMGVTHVLRREPIPGIPFDVGRPIFATRQSSASFWIGPKQTAVIELPRVPTDPRPIYLFARVGLTDIDYEARLRESKAATEKNAHKPSGKRP